MTTETTTPAPAPELPPRPSAEELRVALGFAATYPQSHAPHQLRTEIRYLWSDLARTTTELTTVTQERDASRHNRVRAEQNLHAALADVDRLSTQLATVTQERDKARRNLAALTSQTEVDDAAYDAMRADRDRLAGELQTARAELDKWHNVEAAKAKTPSADDPTEGGRYYVLDPKKDVRVTGLEKWDDDQKKWVELVPACCQGPTPLYQDTRYRAPVTSPQPQRETVQTLTLDNAPIGTRAPSCHGGGWWKVEDGWKAGRHGSVFPRPGGDWDGRLIPPTVGTSNEAILLAATAAPVQPARPQATAWEPSPYELAVLAVKFYAPPFDMQTKASIEMAYSMLTAAAAFLAEKGGAK